MTTLDIDQLTEAEEARRGKLAAEVLNLKSIPAYRNSIGGNRYHTQWGTKTDLGLFRTLKRLVLDGE